MSITYVSGTTKTRARRGAVTTNRGGTGAKNKEETKTLKGRNGDKAKKKNDAASKNTEKIKPTATKDNGNPLKTDEAETERTARPTRATARQQVAKAAMKIGATKMEKWMDREMTANKG